MADIPDDIEDHPGAGVHQDDVGSYPQSDIALGETGQPGLKLPRQTLARKARREGRALGQAGRQL